MDISKWIFSPKLQVMYVYTSAYLKCKLLVTQNVMWHFEDYLFLKYIVGFKINYS